MSALPPDSPRAGSAVTWFVTGWRRVLFAAPADPATAPRWPSVALVLLVPALLVWPSLGHPLFEPDEGRYAQIPREMLETGAWLVPTLQGEPYLDKPPLVYWLVKLAYLALGPTPAAARCVPALAVQLTVLAVYAVGRRGVGERAALAAAFLLALAPGFTGMGRLLLLDGVLTLWVTLSLLCGYEAVRTGRLRWRWWLAAAAASGLGFLTKGPISEMLLFPPLFVAGFLNGGQARVGVRAGAAFGLVVAGVNLPWYVGMTAVNPRFAGHFFWDHNVMRFARPFDHLQPAWYYLPVLAGGLLPALPAAVGYARRLVVGDRGVPVRSAAGGFWLLAGSWCVVFFTASGSKLPTYILPAFPALCLALGEFVARAGWLDSAKLRAAAGVALVAALGFHHGFIPWYARERSPLRDPGRVLPYVTDPGVPVVTYPRHVDSVAVAAGRRDFVTVRSKDMNQVLVDCHSRPKTVVLFTHDHSFAQVRDHLPASLAVTTHIDFRRKGTFAAAVAGATPWGLCDLAVIEPVAVQGR